MGTLPLGGKPEFAAYDAKGVVYVNIEDTTELVAFDAKALFGEGAQAGAAHGVRGADRTSRWIPRRGKRLLRLPGERRHSR